MKPADRTSLMNRKMILLAVCALIGETGARAQILDLTALACGDFVKGDSRSNTTVAVWLNGYYKAAPNPPIIDFDKLNTQGNALVRFCLAHPTMQVSEAAETIMGKGK
jgi:HdeA/HdeB family